LAHRQGRVCLPLWPVGTAGEPFWHGGKGEYVCLIGLLDHLVGLFGTEARARVCAFLKCWISLWSFLARRQGRVCVPFWPVGATGGPFWHGWKGVCVCLFGRVVQLVGLFGTEARARVCAFLTCWRVCVPFWLVDACGCLFGLREQLVGLFGMNARARVCAFLACWRVCVPFWLVGACVCLCGLLAQRVCAFLTCWTSWWAFLARREGRV